MHANNARETVSHTKRDVVHSRIQQYGYFLFCSVFCLYSLFTLLYRKGEDPTGFALLFVYFGATVQIVSAVHSIIFIVLYLTKFGQIMKGWGTELVLLSIYAILWILILFWFLSGKKRTGLDIISDDHTIRYANLYYFCWAGTISVVVLLFTFIRDFRALDLMESMAKRSPRFVSWAALCFFSLVVLISAVTLESTTDLKIAVGVGAAVVVASLIVMCELAYVYEGTNEIESYSIIETETVMSFLSLVAYIVCACYVTMEGGRGSKVGTLYYFIWFSVIASADLTLDCLKQMMKFDEVTSDMPDESDSDEE